jgi:hypothetical protein
MKSGLGSRIDCSENFFTLNNLKQSSSSVAKLNWIIGYQDQSSKSFKVSSGVFSHVKRKKDGEQRINDEEARRGKD